MKLHGAGTDFFWSRSSERVLLGLAGRIISSFSNPLVAFDYVDVIRKTDADPIYVIGAIAFAKSKGLIHEGDESSLGSSFSHRFVLVRTES